MIANENPLDRLEKLGHEALADSELVAVAGDISIDLARDVLAAAGDLTRLHLLSPADLEALPGMTLRRALRLRAAFGLAARLQQRDNARRKALAHPAEVAAFVQGDFMGKEQEEFIVLALDPRHQVLRKERVTIGLADRSQIHAREVFRVGIRWGGVEADPRPQPSQWRPHPIASRHGYDQGAGCRRQADRDRDH